MGKTQTQGKGPRVSATLADEMKRVKDNTNLEAFCNQFLTRRAPRTYNCPLCGSGTKHNKSAAFTVNDNLWYCHSCKEGGSIFELMCQRCCLRGAGDPFNAGAL